MLFWAPKGSFYLSLFLVFSIKLLVALWFHLLLSRNWQSFLNCWPSMPPLFLTLPFLNLNFHISLIIKSVFFKRAVNYEALYYYFSLPWEESLCPCFWAGHEDRVTTLIYKWVTEWGHYSLFWTHLPLWSFSPMTKVRVDNWGTILSASTAWSRTSQLWLVDEW